MPTKIEYKKDRGAIFTVLADGKFHRTVPQETPGAIRRDYETSDGKKGTKYELVASQIGGMMTGLSIYEGDFGKQIVVSLGLPEDEKVSIYLSASSNFGEDFMKKLPNVKIEKEIVFAPYAFDDDGGKKRKGITIYQDGEKIADFYHAKDGDKIKSVNGYPSIPDEATGWDSDEWKLYFLGARKFLIDEIKKNKLFNAAETEVKSDYPTDGINPDEIPF